MGTIVSVEYHRPNAWCCFKVAIIQMDNSDDTERRQLLQCLWTKGSDGVPECR